MAQSAMQELMVDQLRDLYDAEKQLTKALPKLAKAASDEELKQGFRDHLAQTQGHVQRIEQIFTEMGMKAKSKPCEAMKGLVLEGQEAIEEDLDVPVGDIALIAAGRRVEHYEMAAYSTLILASQAMKLPSVTTLLTETMKEEQETDKQLSAVAKRLLKEAVKPPSNGNSATPTDKTASNNGAKSTSKTASKSVAKTSKGQSSNGENFSHTTTDHEEIRD